MKKKKIYAVGALKAEHPVSLYDGTIERLDFRGIADGCSGVIVCFTNKAKANKYAGKKFEVIAFDIATGD